MCYVSELQFLFHFAMPGMIIKYVVISSASLCACVKKRLRKYETNANIYEHYKDCLFMKDINHPIKALISALIFP